MRVPGPMTSRKALWLAVIVLPLARPAAAADSPNYFVQASFDAFYVSERGGSAEPAYGLAVTARPLVGLSSPILGDGRFTLLGGASTSRYAESRANDTDTAFGMARFSKTFEGTTFSASLLAARSYDATFETGVANIFDGTLSLHRTFTMDMLNGLAVTPRLKATRRASDLASAERWDVGASIEMSTALFGGIFTFGGGYNRFEYFEAGRHDDRLTLSASWLIDVNENIQWGVRSEASSTRSNMADKNVDAFEIGPTLRILFTR